MLLFHGTTHNRLMKMLKEGYIGCNKNVWNVSTLQTTYFWTQQYIEEEFAYDSDEHNKEDVMNNGKRLAMESAECALSQEENNLKRVVLIFDDETLKQYGLITTDDSCENMEHCAKFIGKIPVTAIKEVWMDEKNLDKYCLYFKGIAVSRENSSYNKEGINIQYYDEGLSEEEKECAEKMNEMLCEWWMENMQDPDSLIEMKITKEVNK